MWSSHWTTATAVEQVSFNCVAVWLSALLFWLTLGIVSCYNRPLYPVKKKKNDLSTKQLTDTVNNYLVNTVEQLAAKEKDISLRSGRRP